ADSLPARVGPGATGQTVLRQSPPEYARFFIVGTACACPLASKDRDNDFLRHFRFASSMRALVFPDRLLRRNIELLERGHAQAGQRIRSLVISPSLIVAQERKNEPPPAGSLGETGKRAHVLDRTRFRVNVPGRRSVFHAV